MKRDNPTMHNVRRICAALLLGAFASLAAPGARAAEPARRNAFTTPHVLRYATAEDITGLNPHLATQTVVNYLSVLTMAYLFKTGPRNEPVPELATEVPTQKNGGISADGKTITYHLRKGVKWSDGRPFDADDVVFSTRVVLNPKNNEVGRDGWDLIEKIDEPDKYTVVFHLSKPYVPAIFTFFSTAGANPCILPKHLLGDLPDINTAAYNALPVGIGPFKYKFWKRADSVELEPNPLYFRGLPKLQRIVFKIVPDRNTVVTQLRTHEIDLWLPVAARYYDDVKTIDGIAVLRQPSYYFNHVDFNNERPALRDPRVRRALMLATDRKTLRDKIGRGIGILQDDVVSPKNPAFNPNVGFTAYDPQKAAALLESAGWKLGADGVRAKGGLRLTLEFATSTGTPDTDARNELIRAWWKAIGVELTFKHYPSPLMFASYAQGGIIYGGRFDVVSFAWSGDPLGDLSNLYECKQRPPNGQNDPRYCSREADVLMERFKQTYDDAARRPIGYRVQEIIARDVPVFVTAIAEDIYAYNSDFTGFHPNQLSPFDDFMNVDI
jgi:peptide/nickel transport system substrate-binding protein